MRVEAPAGAGPGSSGGGVGVPAGEVCRLAEIEAKLNAFKWEHEWDDSGGFGDLRSATRASSRLGTAASGRPRTAASDLDERPFTPAAATATNGGGGATPG